MLASVCWSIILGFITYKEKSAGNIVAKFWRETRANWSVIRVNTVSEFKSILTNGDLYLIRTCNLCMLGRLDFNFARLGQLEVLILKYNKISNEMLHNISHLKSLKELELTSCVGFNFEGLLHLSSLSSLTKLDLGFSNINDAEVKSIANIPNLRVLNLADCRNITNACIDHISKLSNLRSLYLSYSFRLNNIDFRKLATLKHLEVLYVYDYTIDDQAFRYLLLCHNLREIHIQGCSFKTSSLLDLNKLLYLSKFSCFCMYTEFSSSCFDELQKSLNVPHLSCLYHDKTWKTHQKL